MPKSTPNRDQKIASSSVSFLGRHQNLRILRNAIAQRKVNDGFRVMSVLALVAYSVR